MLTKSSSILNGQDQLQNIAAKILSKISFEVAVRIGNSVCSKLIFEIDGRDR